MFQDHGEFTDYIVRSTTEGKMTTRQGLVETTLKIVNLNTIYSLEGHGLLTHETFDPDQIQS